jgi:adenosine deaminase
MPKSLTPDILRQLPKAELHCHLDGSVRPETLFDLAKSQRVKLPADSADELRDYMHVKSAANLEEYLARFAVTISVMQTEEALERIAYELAADAFREGVMYLEVRNAPVLNVQRGLTLPQVVQATVRGLNRAEKEFGIIGRFIVCSLRHLSPEISLDLARLAVDFRRDGVVAFDLAGGEAGYPAAAHAAAFAFARNNNLAVTVHAGEGYGAGSVEQAVHKCCANRIGHGTRLLEDAELTQYVNDRQIALEICLTSNVQTRAAESYETHPFRQYFEKGMNVTLNTDNRLMSNTTLTDEYVHAAKELSFTFDELVDVSTNGFRSAFIPWQERMKLISTAQKKIEALRGKLQ